MDVRQAADQSSPGRARVLAVRFMVWEVRRVDSTGSPTASAASWKTRAEAPTWVPRSKIRVGENHATAETMSISSLSGNGRNADLRQDLSEHDLGDDLLIHHEP